MAFDQRSNHLGLLVHSKAAFVALKHHYCNIRGTAYRSRWSEVAGEDAKHPASEKWPEG